MANPWEQDWSGKSTGDPWDQNWEAPKSSTGVMSRVGGEVAALTNLVFNIPSFLVQTVGTATMFPVEAIRGEILKSKGELLPPGESPYAWERAASNMQELTAPITDNISRVYKGLVDKEVGAGMEESTTNKLMYKLSEGIESLAQAGQQGLGLDPGATRWMADAALAVFGDMAAKGIAKTPKKIGEAQGRTETARAEERARRDSLGYGKDEAGDIVNQFEQPLNTKVFDESNPLYKFGEEDFFPPEEGKPLPTLPDEILPESQRKAQGQDLEYDGTRPDATEQPLPDLTNVGRMGTLDFADATSKVPDTQRLATRHDIPDATIDFPLRQEVLERPEIKEAIDNFRSEHAELKKVADNAINKDVRNRAINKMTKLEEEFAAGMRELGIDNPQDALGLGKLYSAGKPTKLPVQHGFARKQRGAVDPSVFVEGFSKVKDLADKGLQLIAKYEPSKKGLVVSVKDKAGKDIGGAVFAPNKAGDSVTARGVMVNPEWQRKGVASQIYDFVGELGNDIKPSVDQTQAGKAFWANRQRGAVINPVEAAAEVLKAGGDMLKRAKEIFDQHGKEAAKQFIISYQEQQSQAQLQKTPKNVQQAVEELVATNINAKTANNRIVHNNTQRLLDAADEATRIEAAKAIEEGKVNTLSPEGQNVAKQYQNMVADIGERAVKAGVLDGLRENYVTHAVDWKKADPTKAQELADYLVGSSTKTGGGMSPKSKFGRERKYGTFEELQQAIKDSGLELVTQDLAELYKIYANSMERAIENRKLIDNLKNVTDIDGQPILQKITEDTPPVRGWQELDTPQFRRYSVHPEVMPALKFALEAADPNMFFNAVYNVSQITKRANVVGSLFHAKSLLEAFWSSTSPVHLAKEMSLAAWDKAMGTKRAGITQALDQFKKGGLGDSLDRFIREGGLQLDVPEDVLQGLMSRLGAAADTMISKYAPTNRILERSLNKVEKYTLGLTDKFTWDFLHTGLKASVALKKLDDARLQAMKDGVPFDEVQAMREISSNINNTFGGLNWFEVARRSNTEMGKRMAMSAFNPSTRKRLQILLFAPDWTISTLRAFTTALPKELNPRKWNVKEGLQGLRKPKTEQDYARLYQIKTALTYLTILNGINYLTAGRPIWENKDPTRIEFKDGTSMQAAKHAMEPYHWIADPDKTLTNKLGFIPRALIVGGGGVEYASPTAPKMVDPSGLNRAKAVAKSALPFQITAGMQAPEGEAAKRALYGTLGVPVYGSTKEQRRQRNRERAKEAQRLRKEWRQKAKERGWE